MDFHNVPFACHVFVCVNDRRGSRKSCADGDNLALKDALKQAVNDAGLRGRVRVSHSGCLGLCEDGPNVLIYPQGLWLSGVTAADLDAIVARIRTIVDG